MFSSRQNSLITLAILLFSREFTEAIVSSERPLEMARAQFFLQTTFIPDETYLGTLASLTPQLQYEYCHCLLKVHPNSQLLKHINAYYDIY